MNPEQITQEPHRMSTWTKMRIDGLIKYSTNSIKTTVTIKTLYGEYTENVDKLKEKLKDRNLLPVVRKMFQGMLDYVENGDS